MLDTITAKVIEDSISTNNIRLTTLQLRYPRMIHADFMTHRVFSRNGRSSRAVPVTTLLSEEAYIPRFGMNKPGMQAGDYFDQDMQEMAEKIWLEMIDAVRSGVAELTNLKVHKQWANRPLEWFGYIDVLVTSTSWANFDGLRNHQDAQPEIITLAQRMIEARKNSKPTLLVKDQWHLPYVNAYERLKYNVETLKKLSTARCARLSYKPFNGDDSIEKEFERYEKLMVSAPLHASPAEHQATPDEKIKSRWMMPELHGNFHGWIQNRKQIVNEYIPDSWEIHG